MKKRCESSGGRRGTQQNTWTEISGDSVRYVSSIKESECAKPQVANVAFSCEKEDYNEMSDKPIYDETF